MKRLRDILIIVVLAGVVIWFVARFIHSVHEASVNMSAVVAQAEMECAVDGMLCHVGYDSFQSVEDAEAYLKSPEHLAAVKAREEEKKGDNEKRRRVDELARKGKNGVIAACIKDATLNCNLIDEATLTAFAEVIVQNEMAKEAQKP
jgi:hypothetical protein